MTYVERSFSLVSRGKLWFLNMVPARSSVPGFKHNIGEFQSFKHNLGGKQLASLQANHFTSGQVV